MGARPNFIKAAPVIAALGRRHVKQVLIHTGQHYDDALSEVFFRELGLPRPDLDLGVGSGTHARQTAALLNALESAFTDLAPALVVLYGDINSTLAGALAAAKLGMAVAHVEAGLRSFDMGMPEEVNRRITDLLSDLLFVTSPEAMDHLAAEGLDTRRAHFVGNPMIDTLLANLDRFDPLPRREALGLGERYGVVTIHRPSNVDRIQDAQRLVRALAAVSELIELVLPLHPRGRQTLEAAGLMSLPRLRVIEPQGYVDFISLVRGAALVITDSGGIQEETTILGVPCLTMRPNTERPITISHGTNQLVQPDGLLDAATAVLSGATGAAPDGPPLWDGHAGDRIAAIMEAWLSKRGNGVASAAMAEKQGRLVGL